MVTHCGGLTRKLAWLWSDGCLESAEMNDHFPPLGFATNHRLADVLGNTHALKASISDKNCGLL